MTLSDAVRAIAIYLPQFHPIPENDAWWGKGFTEWTNVTRARPLVPGHYQPHLPADLGFCDLRLPETRIAQAELARSYGIEGFCYYHYWFNGRRIIERPFEEVLASGQPDFPFCLCWANENWARNWDGKFGEKLLTQEYSPEDDIAHIRSLLPAFADPRYIRVEGRPLFLVYSAAQLPDPQATCERWRTEVTRAGLPEPYLVRVESFHEIPFGDPRPLGFDAAMAFQPAMPSMGTPLRGDRFWRIARRLKLAPSVWGEHAFFDYGSYVQRVLAEPLPGYPRFPCVCPSWDNVARRKKGATIFLNSTPELYESWLSAEISRNTTNLIFINAWNEWAEGNHLEPDQKWGLKYLEATKRGLSLFAARNERPTEEGRKRSASREM